MIGEEDCLNLNVYAPKKAAAGQKLPVYVWVYGGGYVFGDKYEFGMYDPHSLMDGQEMIIVAMNYRLGVLGFLGNTAIVNKYHPGTTGNQALLDQVLALEWVQANIANFGGDPDYVTLGGESAGAFSTVWHLASPVSKGLFSQAVMESGTGDSRQFYYTKNESISFGEAVAIGGFDCAGSQQDLLDCLRTKKPHDLMTFIDILAEQGKTHYIPELYPAMPWGAVIDGVVMLDTPTKVLEEGKGNNVPLLIGTNKREGSLFLFWIPQRFPGVPKLFKPVIEHFIPNATDLDRVLQTYQIAADAKYDKQKTEDLLTDYFFKCGTRRIVRALAKQGSPVYEYEFTFDGGFITDLMQDCHAAELPFVFGNWDTLPLGPDIKQREMSNHFQYYWRNWIQKSDPNAAGDTKHPAWPAHDTDGIMLKLELPPVPASESPASDICDMWDDISALSLIHI